MSLIVRWCSARVSLSSASTFLADEVERLTARVRELEVRLLWALSNVIGIVLSQDVGFASVAQHAAAERSPDNVRDAKRGSDKATTRTTPALSSQHDIRPISTATGRSRAGKRRACSKCSALRASVKQLSGKVSELEVGLRVRGGEGERGARGCGAGITQAAS